MSRRGYIDTPHGLVCLKTKDGENRHKNRCVYLIKSRNYCKKLIQKCTGSSHCDYYKEKDFKKKSDLKTSDAKTKNKLFRRKLIYELREEGYRKVNPDAAYIKAGDKIIVKDLDHEKAELEVIEISSIGISANYIGRKKGERLMISGTRMKIAEVFRRPERRI